MFLKKIELENFRNYKKAFLEFLTPKTVIIGENAQGKTNFLEAIYYIGMFSSNRAKSDSEIVLWDSENALIRSIVEKNDVDVDFDIIIDKNGKKTLKVNNLKKTKLSDYAGYIPVVNFSTSDLMLLRGSPQDRRNYLDDCVSKIYPIYKDRLSRFNKIKEQRNNFLKKLKGYLGETSKNMLSVWNEQLIVCGSNIVFLRNKYLKEIEKIAKEKHKNISKDEELSLSYISTVCDDFESAENIAECYKRKIEEMRDEEVSRGQTLIGPHRDDIDFFINGIDSKKYASQGQQRTIVLSLKLAELDFIDKIRNEKPILLLDDVLAELDAGRQNYLLKSINEDIQTIVTTTDLNNFPEDYLQNISIYSVSGGEIKKS